MAGKTSGADLVNGLDGSEHAKRWCRSILETLSGETTVVDAAKGLDCNEAYFYRIRGRALQAMVQDLEPRRTGPKPAEPDPKAERISELEDELRHAKAILEAASARVSLTLALPKSTRRPKGRGRANPPS